MSLQNFSTVFYYCLTSGKSKCELLACVVLLRAGRPSCTSFIASQRAVSSLHEIHIISLLQTMCGHGGLSETQPVCGMLDL